MLEVLKKYRLPIIIFLIIVALTALIVFLVPYLNEQALFVPDPEDTTDATESEEVLNDHLSSLLSSAAHRDYVSDSYSTRYSNAPASLLYSSNLDWWDVGSGPKQNGASITAFATALSILSSARYTPASVAYVTYDESFWDLFDTPPSNLYERLASFYGLFFRELPVMNSNILNYYLDNDCVVIVKARGKTPFSSSEDSYLVVYGGDLISGFYSVSSPTLDEFLDTALVRSDLFESLVSDEAFYVFAGSSTRYDFSPYSSNFNSSLGK